MTQTSWAKSEQEQYDTNWHAPLQYIVNGTFDVTQNSNWFDQNDFFIKNQRLWDRVRDPVHHIKKDGGFKRFFHDEFISKRSAPNYLLHTLGGAYDGYALERYYSFYGFRHSLLFATMTSYLARWGNEVIEEGNQNISSHDHIADLFFFDSLGILLSTNKSVMNFLLDDMAMQAWHSIPYYDPESEKFINAGLNYIIRPHFLRPTQNIAPFFYFGMQNIFGLSYIKNDKIFSIGSGFFLTNPLEEKMRFVTSFFYEKNRRLAFSGFLNGSEDFRWRVNFYPSFFQYFNKLQVGLLLGEKRGTTDSNFVLGFNLNLPFGIGLH